MKATLYKLKEGYVLCSKKRIPKVKGTAYYSPTHNKVFYSIHENEVFELEKLVLTQSPDFSELKEEDANRIGWFDLEKLALEEYPVRICDSYDIICHRVGDDMNEQNREHFTKGLKKHAELTSDRRFTDMDILNFPKFLHKNYNTDYDGSHYKNGVDITLEEIMKDYIQSLSQPKSWEVTISEENGVYKVLSVV